MNFSNETINQIVKTIKENTSDIKALMPNNDGKSLKDSACILLKEKYNILQNEAEDVVDDLMKGISEFDAQMKNVQKEGTQISVRKNLEKLSDGMNDEDCHNFYANILTALQLLSSGNNSNVENVLAKNSKLGVDELIANIEKNINDTISLDLIGNAVKEEIDADILNELAIKAEMNKDEFRLSTALWLYILQRDGIIKLSESEIDVPPMSVGVLAAAGVETIIKTNELVQGEISLETWQTVLKCILFSVLFILLVSIMAYYMAFYGVAFAFTLAELFGGEILALIISSIVSLLLCYAVCNKLSDLFVKSAFWFSDFYDKYIVVITDKVKKIFESAKNFAAGVIKKSSVPSPVQDPIVSPSTGQTKENESEPNHQVTEKPAMA